MLAQRNVLAPGKRTRSTLTCSLNVSFFLSVFAERMLGRKKTKKTEMATSHEKATSKNGVIYT